MPIPVPVPVHHHLTDPMSPTWWLPPSMQPHTFALWLAGFFAVLASTITFVHIGRLIVNPKWNLVPELRTYAIRILLMVPIYASISYLGLRQKDYTIYYDVVRECYEAFVIYCFFSFLIRYLGGKRKLERRLLLAPEPMSHFFPFCCLTSWELGLPFIRYIMLGVLQYTVVKGGLGITAFVLGWAGHYHASSFAVDDGYLWLTIINNASQVWAMYCLIQFYINTSDDLAPIRPIPKILCIKALVFFTFWQSAAISILVQTGVIVDNGTYTAENVAEGLQDFLICIEMFIASVAHIYAFSVDDFNDRSEMRPFAPRNHSSAAFSPLVGASPDDASPISNHSSAAGMNGYANAAGHEPDSLTIGQAMKSQSPAATNDASIAPPALTMTRSDNSDPLRPGVEVTSVRSVRSVSSATGAATDAPALVTPTSTLAMPAAPPNSATDSAGTRSPVSTRSAIIATRAALTNRSPSSTPARSSRTFSASANTAFDHDTNPGAGAGAGATTSVQPRASPQLTSTPARAAGGVKPASHSYAASAGGDAQADAAGGATVSGPAPIRWASTIRRVFDLGDFVRDLTDVVTTDSAAVAAASAAAKLKHQSSSSGGSASGSGATPHSSTPPITATATPPTAVSTLATRTDSPQQQPQQPVSHQSQLHQPSH